MSLHGKKNTQHRIIGIVKLTWWLRRVENDGMDILVQHTIKDMQLSKRYSPGRCGKLCLGDYDNLASLSQRWYIEVDKGDDHALLT